MANAAQRNKSQQALNRVDLLERLGECDRADLIAVVRKKNLPKATAEWSVEDIADVVNTVHPLVKSGKLEPVTPKPPVERQVHTLPEGPAYSIVYESEDEHTTKVYQFKTRDLAVDFTNNIGEGFTGHAVLRLPDMKGIPMSVLIVIANKNAQTPIAKFANADLARESAFKSLENASVETTKKPPRKAPVKSDTPRAVKPINYPAGESAKPVRAGSKIAAIIDLLAVGTTLEAIKEAGDKFGKPINARAWLGYDLKQKGYGAIDKNGTIMLVYPKGMRKPLPHTEKAEAPEPKPKKAPPAAKTLAEAQSAAAAKPAIRKVAPAKKSPAIK